MKQKQRDKMKDTEQQKQRNRGIYGQTETERQIQRDRYEDTFSAMLSGGSKTPSHP